MHFKKAIFVLFILIIGLNTIGFAENAPIPIKFEKNGGGQYIYCNNPEMVTANGLSTKENPNATYMMKCEQLKPDNYSVFFCFYNWTDFDIEPDIEFKGNADITINSVGYYMPRGFEYWDCLGAWSDLMGIKIRSLNGYQEFVPYLGETNIPANIKLDGGNNWISKYIYNYDVIKPRSCFNMLVNFTINSGEAEVNFAALKNYGKTGDRSMHNPDAAPGSYNRDTSVKGIDTETLPIVKADLNIQIDSQIKNGESILFKVFNQYYNEGNVVPYFMTNINPSRDMYKFSKGVAVGSDMLSLAYKDDSKLSFYGKDVPNSQINNIWYFDIYHHDTKGYEQGMPWKANEHMPNNYTGVTMDVNNLPDVEWEANLGNFGVTNRYNLTITNNDSVKRVLNYNLDTVLSSNIAIARDEQGNMLNPYTLQKENPFAISKKVNGNKEEVCMFSAEIEPGETKKYILDVILPTNCYGGMLNIFKVDDHKYLTEKPSTPYPEYTSPYEYSNVFFNGENNMKWDSGEFYEYSENGIWEQVTLPYSAKSFFASRGKEYSIIKTSDGFAARFSGWDGVGGNVAHKETENKVYVFDKDYNYLSSVDFPDYIYDMVYVNNVLYLSSDKIYESKDGKTFQPSKELTMPIYNGKYAVMKKPDGFYMKNKADQLTKISFEGSKPNEIFNAGNIFYYRKSWKSHYTDTFTKNVLSVSSDGINWTDLTFPDKFYELMDVNYIGNKIYTDCKYEVFSFDYEAKGNNVKVNLNNELLSFDTHAKIVNDRTMVPLRFLFEKLSASVKWDDSTQQITVTRKNDTLVFKIGSNSVYVNGQEKTVDVPPYIEKDKTMIPLRFLSENLGYNVQWDETNDMVVIKG